jgi:hypothetical protein
MAKGIIRSNNGSTSRSAYPVHTGTIEDTQSNLIYNFEQPLFDELGLKIGMKVSFSTVRAADGTEIAIGLETAEKGEILTVTTDGGTLIEKATGGTIDFTHPRAKEANLTAGAIVKFERVNYNGKPVAASVTLVR